MKKKKSGSSLRPLLIRVTAFVILFLFLSGWYGPWIIRTRLLYEFGFFIYGNLGKVLLFSFVSFVLLTRDRITHIHLTPYNPRNVIYLYFAALLTPLFFPVATFLLSYPTFIANLPLSILAHAFILAIPILLALGIFGPTFLITFIKQFAKPLQVCLALATASYFGIFFLWQLWPLFSGAVLGIVAWLFHLTFDNVVVFAPRTLFVERFAVSIDQACSGLESFLLFTGLFALISYIDWKKFDHRRVAIVYILGMIGLFFVNVLRVYSIIWSGLIFSPQLAATLFHTYLGLILFLIYFVILLKFTFPWLHKKGRE